MVGSVSFVGQLKSKLQQVLINSMYAKNYKRRQRTLDKIERNFRNGKLKTHWQVNP